MCCIICWRFRLSWALTSARHFWKRWIRLSSVCQCIWRGGQLGNWVVWWRDHKGRDKAAGGCGCAAACRAQGGRWIRNIGPERKRGPLQVCGCCQFSLNSSPELGCFRAGWCGLGHRQMFEGFGVEHTLFLPDGARPRPDKLFKLVFITVANLTDVTVQRGDFFVDGLGDVDPMIGVFGSEKIHVADAMGLHFVIDLFWIVHGHASIGNGVQGGLSDGAMIGMDLIMLPGVKREDNVWAAFTQNMG